MIHKFESWSKAEQLLKWGHHASNVLYQLSGLVTIPLPETIEFEPNGIVSKLVWRVDGCAVSLDYRVNGMEQTVYIMRGNCRVGDFTGRAIANVVNKLLYEVIPETRELVAIHKYLKSELKDYEPFEDLTFIVVGPISAVIKKNEQCDVTLYFPNSDSKLPFKASMSVKELTEKLKAGMS